MIELESHADGRDARFLDALAESDRDRILDASLYCEFCNRVYPDDFGVGVSGSQVQCLHCYFASGFGDLSRYLVDPEDEDEDEDGDR